MDLDRTFALLEQETVDKDRVLRRKNIQATQTLAVADSKLKDILSGYSLADWAGALRETTAYNDRSHSYLMGCARQMT